MPEFFGKSENQTKESTVSLTVYDASGAVIPGARAEFSKNTPENGALPATILFADALGSASLKVKPGTYLLSVTQRGFKKVRFRFTVGGGQTWGIATILSVMPTCDGVEVTVPERSTTPPSPNDHIEPKRP
jgi:hypothetical protein